MLKTISIHNYALIDRLEIDFSSGFSVITGETGTGKSVLLGAISMMLGQRSDTKAIRDGADRCTIEGHFDITRYNLHSFFDIHQLDYDASDCIIRREISSTGRSRAFINDTPVSVAVLRDIGARLIDIHSQHQNLLLGDKTFQLNILDTLAGNENELQSYRQIYSHYVSQQQKLVQLRKEIEKSRSDEDFLRFRYEEIERNQFTQGEQEELEQEQAELSHAEEIQSALYTAAGIIDGDDATALLPALRDAANRLQRISCHYPAAGELSERLDSNYIELKDCLQELQQRAGNITFAPDRLDFVNNRLSTLYDLLKKHKASNLDELLAIAHEIHQKLEQIDNGDEEIVQQQKLCEKLFSQAHAAALKLTASRQAVADKLQHSMQEILLTLSMPLVRFTVEFHTTELCDTGVDAVEFLFSANSSSPLQPLSDVASGGEMARVMLALKSLVADKKEQPTLIFDEIDTGISGVTARRMGLLMKRMGSVGRQVISITHLPQVAALGERHYKVFKQETTDGTHTSIIRLAHEERVKEIAQMMSGEILTDAAIDNARQLLSEEI